MLGLPASTEIRKGITKKKVYERFGAEMSAERRKSFDADIARITLVNEVSPVSVNIPEGENVKCFFVVDGCITIVINKIFIKAGFICCYQIALVK